MCLVRFPFFPQALLPFYECLCILLTRADFQLGQVFWAAALSPPRSARLLSYCTGALTIMSWTFATAGCFVLAGKMVAGFAVLVATGYQMRPYHILLLALAAAALSLIFNVWLFRWVPKVACFLVVFINVGTVFILVALLVRTERKAAASSVFAHVVNETGWSSNALVFCLNILPGCLSVCAFDTAAHMAEEMPRPQRHVPQVMVYTAILSAVGGFIMAIVYQFCTQDPAALLDPIGGQPILQLLLDSLRSRPLVILAAVVYCIVVILGCIFFVTTLSRIIWAFSSHGGTCYGATLGVVDPGLGILTCTGQLDHGVWVRYFVALLHTPGGSQKLRLTIGYPARYPQG